MNIVKYFFFCLFLLQVIVSSARSDSTSLNTTKIKGFFTTWNQHKYSISQAPLDKLDEVVVCFAWANEVGDLITSEIKGIDFIVKHCHKKNVKVTLAIGGATKSAFYHPMSASPVARQNFISETIKYCKAHQIDGINIDWEHWPNPNKVDTVVNRHITTLFKELYAQTQKNHLWLSFDAYATDYYGKHYPSELINYCDELIIMSYDGAGVWSAIGHHSDMNLFTSGYTYWLNKIGEENTGKITMGIPFYGISFDKNHTPGNSATARAVLYNDYLMDYNKAYENDTIQTKKGVIIHNGIKTLEQKVKTVKKNGNIGIAIWEISFDHGTGKQSLIDFLFQEVNK